MKLTAAVFFICIHLKFLCIKSSSSQRPHCQQCNENLYCNCSAMHLLQVPVVPANVLSLDVSYNNIESVGQKDLSMYVEIRSLNLQKNKLTMIHDEAFCSQLNMKVLDLSFNKLENISSSWFYCLKSLKHLNLLGNQYTTLGSVPLFHFLTNLETLKFGNALLKEVRKNVFYRLSHLNEMIFEGGSLKQYESGSFKMSPPIARVSMSLQGLFEDDTTLVSKIFQDVSHPGTSLAIKNVVLNTKKSMQPFKVVKNGGTTRLIIHNISTTDAAVTHLLGVMDGSQLSYLALEDIMLKGGGHWEKANISHYENLHTIFIQNAKIDNFVNFSSMIELGLILKYILKLSVINCTFYVMPCITSYLMRNVEYLDFSQNLLSDMAIQETLCYGAGIMSNLNTLNVSQNSLKSIQLMSHMVTRLQRLTFLDMSNNDFTTMPQECTWPESLQFLNLSATKLHRVTTCLPPSLTVLDLSQNDLTLFHLTLPNLVELNLSGNRFMHIPDGRRFPSLKTLIVQRNSLSMFNKSDLMSFNQLQDLQAGQNNYVCTCEFVAFFKDDVDQFTTLGDSRSNYVCDSPFSLRGRTVDSADLSVFECHMIPAVCILCSAIVLLLLLVAVTCHKLHVLWYLQMIVAWLKAKRKAATCRAGENLRYDAFVSYSQRDAEWVEEILLPKLESAQPPFALCLHKRDFLPGRWIVDNIIESIEKSHRTLFVLSEHFVTSEWCRYELDFSHFRIVDEHNDSAVLVLLEPIAKETIPKRFCKLRKMMNSRTYLEWPQEEERREEFWNNLQAALSREGP